jgi:pimeloyl-ACP methyl ester carboxylesterase
MMIEVRKITTAPGLTFDTSIAGSETSPLVLMLHGFCVSRHFWAHQILALAEAGYFAVAPNQRGDAAEARPDPAIFDNYGIEKLMGDALDIVAAVGRGAAASTSSVTTGAAACRGSSPTATRSVSPR